MAEMFSLNNVSKIVPFKKTDKFTLVKIYVMALGSNANMSYIGEEAEQAARDGVYGLPVVGYLYQGEDGEYHMAGHEQCLEIKDGKAVFKSMCVPYGFVIPNGEARYEEQTEPNGETKTYLVVDAALWTGRFPELGEAVYNDETLFAQSMEIEVSDYRRLPEDKRYVEILSYDYSALCLLGKSDDPEYNVEPCFPMARVEAYNADEFASMMQELKAEFAKCYQFTEKGGEMTMTDESIVTEPVVTTEEQPVVETTTTPEESQVSSENGEQGGEPVTEESQVEETPAEDYSTTETQPEPEQPTEPETVKFSITYNKLYDILSAAVWKETAETYTYLLDFTEDTVFVCERCQLSWDVLHNYRASYTVDENDHVTIGEWHEVFHTWATAEELAALESMKTEFAALQSYKAQREQEDKVAEYNSVLDEFSDLAANEEFQAVRERYLEYATAEELRKECFAIRGKSVAPNFSRSTKNAEPVISIRQEKESDSDSIIARFHREYSKK